MVIYKSKDQSTVAIRQQLKLTHRICVMVSQGEPTRREEFFVCLFLNLANDTQTRQGFYIVLIFCRLDEAEMRWNI